MLIARFLYSGLLPALLGRGLLATATTTATSHTCRKTANSCRKIAGQRFADPVDVMACQKSFPFNETIRQNVISVVSSVFDFYTFEDYYLKSPPPFQESTTDIRAEIARINKTHYATDYDFNIDVYNFTTRLNDGHTRYISGCYSAYENILPAAIILLDTGIYVAPDLVEFLNQLGPDFIDYYEKKSFNWQRLAGAKVLTIEGKPASDYIDEVASTISGNFLDHGVRVNSVVSSYRLMNGTFSQRLGDLAARNIVTQTSVKFSLITVNSTTPENVDVPFVALFTGTPFTDGRSYWENNCAANNQTNGVDRRSDNSDAVQSQSRLARAALMDSVSQGATTISITIPLPKQYLPTLPPANGSAGVIKSYIMPGNKTGVLFVGSFGTDQTDFDQFMFDVYAATKQFLASGVTNILFDVTGNPGGFVNLGHFLIQFFTGVEGGYPGFQTTTRANSLAKKILKAGIRRGLNDSFSDYASDQWQFLNGTQMPDNYNYYEPSVHTVINGHNQPTSQRFEDAWSFRKGMFPEKPPFDLDKIVIVTNANCASTCSLFISSLHERYHTKIAVFGGNQARSIQSMGAAGNQVLDWTDLDSDIKTAGLKDEAGTPPDLIVASRMTVNWRTAYSNLDETEPLAYANEPPQYRFPYTIHTYNDPQNVWTFAEKHFFG